MLTLEAAGTAGSRTLGSFADLTVIVFLIGLLILKEVSASVPSTRARMTAQLIDVVLVPVLALYASLVAARLLQGLT